MVRVINKSELHATGTAWEFEGIQFGGTSLTFILVEAPPGIGPRLHAHPYDEVFIVHEGQATFTAGQETVEVSAGQVVIVGAGTPHRFVNSGPALLKQVDIHLSPYFVTEWLEP